MEKIRIFVDRHGFFILLITCIAVIVGSGFWAFSQKAREVPATQEAGSVNDYVPSQTGPSLAPPVRGEMLRGFAETAYLETLQLYASHEAVDLAADAGAQVYAAAEGTVMEAFRSGTHGGVLAISHADGLETRYAGLKWPPAVQTGHSVAAGEMIGTVGSIPLEAADPPHLHFSVRKDGKAVDPALYLME